MKVLETSSKCVDEERTGGFVECIEGGEGKRFKEFLYLRRKFE